MMSSPSPSGRAPPPPLPAAMYAEFSRLQAKLGQNADPGSVDRLARLSEAAAWRVLGALEAHPVPVRNLSAFLTHLVKEEEQEELRRNAVGVPTAESAVHFPGPFRGPHREASISGRPHEDYVPMEVESPVAQMITGPSNQARIEPVSPVRQMHRMVEEEVQSPLRFISPGLQHRPPLSSAAVSPVANRGATPQDFTPSPVRHITQRVQEIGGPSGRAGVAKPYPLYNGNSVRVNASPQMLALGELEFDRFFLIQVYLGDKKIEDIIQDAGYIRSLKSLPMDHFESKIWNEFGEKLVPASDRRKNLDWDPNKTREYHCNIEKKGDSIITTFKGPYLENARTHLQKVVGDDNVLVVNFAEIPGNTNGTNNLGMYRTFYQHVGKDGILLGLRRYRFFIYKEKDGGKEKKYKELTKDEKAKKIVTPARCYFVRTESGWDSDEPYILSGCTIDQARKLFMHVHTAPTVAKYLSRFALILSKTITLDLDFEKVHVQIINDEPCRDEFGEIVIQYGKPLIHTDGTGLISVDLAMKCPTSVFRGKFLNDAVDSELQYSTVEYPLLMQFRMFYKGYAVKGTFLVDKRLPPETICIRPSMIKIYPDPKFLAWNSFNSLEIVTTSYRPKRGHTSRHIIALLHYGGVKAEYFLYLVRKALEDVKKARHTTRDSLEVAFNHGDLDNSMSARMILSGILPENEAYLKHQIAIMTQQERRGLLDGKIPIDESYYLMGTTDPTGTLKQNQVCIILEHGQVSGKVLVYKPPGLHFGDIHVLTATYIDGLEKVVGNSKYAIFFPTCGPRSLADEMANSDFDGDTYWVSRNPQLLEQFTQSHPWVQPEPKNDVEQMRPDHYDVSGLEDLLFNEFLKARFTPSYAYAKGVAANCWLALMDRLLTENVPENEQHLLKKKLCDLVDIYYLALDASKEGRKVSIPNELKVKTYPHFMEKEESYNSTSVLGKIYDEVKAQEESESVSPIKIVPLECFTEEVVSEACKSHWKHLYGQYLQESRLLFDLGDQKLRNIKFQELYQKYKEILYGPAGEFEGSQKDRSELFKEACAIYQIVYYDKAIPNNDIGKCGFAWKVAGRALCTLYAMKRGGDTALCSFPILEDIFRRKPSRVLE